MAERSVGLIVMTEIPSIGLVAVLRERGYWNFEKMKSLKWPGCLQGTASGKLEAGESFIEALWREVKEELGTDFKLRLQSYLDLNLSELVEVDRSPMGEGEVVTYAVKLNCGLLGKIRLSPETGGLRLVSREEIEGIIELDADDKDQEREGMIARERKFIAMFPEVKGALAKAFVHFS